MMHCIRKFNAPAEIFFYERGFKMKLLEFPKEILIEIIKYSDLNDLKRISLTCILLKNIALEESIWRDKLKSFSSLDNYFFHPKQLVESYATLINETNEGYFVGCSMVHQDLKNLILKTPGLREKLSEKTVNEIIEINEFICRK